MSKKVIVVFILLLAFICTSCSGESEEQKQAARMKKIEALKKNCKENERIEVWKVTSIEEKRAGVKEISLTALDNSNQTKILQEGFNDLKPDMEVIIKISVNDLSLNQKYGDSSVAREFFTIVDYY
jgi:hypothetical protein